MKRNPVIFTCFIICLSAFLFSLPNLLAQAPPGYTYCAGENGTFTLPAKSHLAYGANGKFKYLFNQTGTVTFSNDFFGGDPIFGVPKSGYYKISDGTESSVTLVNAMQSIRNHITGANILTAAQLNSISATIQQNIFLIAKDSLVVQEAFAVADTYETIKGPIFLNSATTGSFPNDFGALDGFELVRAVFLVQQGIMDYVYLPEEVEKYKGMIAGRYFKTANYFPGSCPNPVDPAATYTAIINASMPAEYGKRTAFSSTPARRPTGYYLAPGNLGRVRVPEHMVNKGFKILVGAHTFERTGSNPTRRFFRVTNTFPINDTITEIINPFGGGIYIITPYLADEGIVEIQLTNVVPAPFFSAKNSDQTTLQEWLDVQRHNPAPWADFESDKYMMQVPTSWIYNYSDPVTLMTDWDQRLDVVSRLLGYPAVRNNTILYLQIDVDIMFGGYGIGNPQINNTYNPYTVENGNKNHWMLKPGAGFWETEFHEMGHAQLFSNFPGEGEASVNLLSAAIYNQLYGIDIDVALGKSFDNQAHRTRDQAALNWMVTPNFRAGNPMDISNTTKDEVRYQHRGYAKYVEIAALFGWEVLDSFYNREQLDFIAQTPSDGLTGVDSRILRMSRAAGTDLRPLIHFWGVQPKNPAVLESRILSENLQPSKLICDRLTHYKSIIPADNTQFLAHAYAFFAGPIPSGGNPDYGSGWYNVWKSQYNSSHGAAANAAMQNIIDLYFPEGCPLAPAPPEVTVNSAAICPGESVTLTASGAAFYQWSTGATGNSITVSPSQTTTLTVIGKSAGVLSFPATATVTVNPLPVLSVTDAVVCAGSPATLTVTGANDYMWSDGSTGSSVTFAGEQSVTLTVTGISEGCESAPVEATVTVNPLPVLSVTDAVVCAGSPATLTVTGANDYMWSDGSTGSSVTVMAEQTTEYTITGTSMGCSSTISSVVVVHPLPIVQLGADIVLQAGQQITLDAAGQNQTYQWSNGATTAAIVVQAMGTYTVTVTSTSGCTATDEIEVSIISSVGYPEERMNISVMPNPTLDRVNVICTGSMTNYVRVIDEWGRIVFEDNQLVADGEARQIDFSALPAATYRILVSGPDIKETLMVIRQ
ncbi:MAG: M60 family metallopeptidase [Bacteroidota bacterium]